MALTWASAGEVRPPLAPVDAVSAQWAAVASQRRNVDRQQRQPAVAFRCDVEMPAAFPGALPGAFDDGARSKQCIGEGDPEAAGEMVVTGAALTHLPVA